MHALFLKAIALNYLFAYLSLFWQLKGLYGSNGILPIKDYVALYRPKSLFLFFSHDIALQAVALLGVTFSLLILFGIQSWILFLLLYIGYLSFVNAGQDFLSFQWDCLLLEAGLMTTFYAMEAVPSIFMTLSFWLLAFRLIFSSGYTKWKYGSREWHDRTAMSYHYETEPLPNRLAYFLHQMPLGFAKFSTLLVYFFELFVPLLFFLPDPLRSTGAILSIFFQLLIFATGNFAFFNTLSIALCLPLFIPLTLENLTPVGLIFIFLQLVMLVELIKPTPFTRRIRAALQEYRAVNSYGLFVHMTTWRDEITIEGSLDAVHFQPYTFKWKPGDLRRPPKQVAPHQPRLDWQMWFAALSKFEQNVWFKELMIKILEGSEPVLALFENNPFPDSPPKYLQARIDRYHFTDIQTLKKSGKWWKKEKGGLFCPPIRLKEKS